MISGVGKRKQQHVRIIAGEFRGRRLAYPETGAIRPTMDRTREALFSVIQQRVEQCVFVDLFSAAGGVGIEALSRGASMVHFVEREPKTLECLRGNLASCGVEGDRFQIHAEDAMHFLDRGGLEALADIIIFADPPYGSDETSNLLTHFDKKDYNNVLLLMLEHRHIIDMPQVGSLVCWKSKRYGDSILTFWARQL
jgi:16S rRNA (guanine(966)-N(2))-methyltransferase RsmD